MVINGWNYLCFNLNYQVPHPYASLDRNVIIYIVLITLTANNNKGFNRENEAITY